MIRLNRILAAVAIAVLMVTLSLLSWLRRHTSDELERSVLAAAALFDQGELVRRTGDAIVLDFEQTEALARLAESGPMVRETVVTLVLPEGEHPVWPWKLYPALRDQWRTNLTGWRREPLGTPERPFGYLYLDMDLSLVRSVTWAIGAVGLAIVLMLFTLLARLWRQATSLRKTTIELDQRKRELIRLERLALAGQLAAGLLHDLRKPVLHIKDSLDELDEALGDYAPAAAGLQDLRHQTRLFFQMLSETQMERFVQSDRVSEEYVDITPILEYSLNLVRYERRGVEVVRQEDPELPPVLAQPFRLIQLFSNLILNAYEALKGKGRIVIAAAQEREGVTVRVSDNGPGIAAEAREHIFDPFFSTKPEGTGLGLAISRLIVEELGGKISLEDSPAGGASFRVWLPRDRE